MKAYCFPGQGPQDITLITQLAQIPDYAHYQSSIMDATGFNLQNLIDLPKKQQETAVRKNEIASLLTTIYALIDLEKLQTQPKPDFLIGYSVGQYVALYVAGSISQKTLFSLVWNRCVFMNEANAQKPGRMAAIIGMPIENVQKLCEKHNLQISNYNARGQYTIAGALLDLENAISDSIEQGAHKSILINTEGAWHSHFMKPAEFPFRALLETIKINEPQIPVIDNVTGKFLPEDDETAIKEQLVKHLSHAVLWEQGIHKLIEKGANQFIEVGYGNMLTKFGFFITRDVEFTTCEQQLKTESCAV